MYNNKEYQYTNITTNTTTEVFTGKGILQAITINTTAAGAITIQDGGVALGVLVSNATVGTYWYNIAISDGLDIVTGASSDITVTWSKD
jgi:hypothetical protein